MVDEDRGAFWQHERAAYGESEREIGVEALMSPHRR